jgi:superfamily II DNA or RNA helicase
MPTGSGKTAVLTLVPFLLQAERILVITANRLVRHQIKNELQTLKTLRNLGVVPDIGMPSPKVEEVKERITDQAQWGDVPRAVENRHRSGGVVDVL